MIDGVLLPAGACVWIAEEISLFTTFPLLFLSSETGKRMIDGMLLSGFAFHKTIIKEMMILDTMMLWTRQVPQVLTALLEDGAYRLCFFAY